MRHEAIDQLIKTHIHQGGIVHGRIITCQYPFHVFPHFGNVRVLRLTNKRLALVVNESYPLYKLALVFPPVEECRCDSTGCPQCQ